LLPQLAVDLTTVTDASYDYDPSGVVHFANDPVIPNADTERLETGQLLRSGWARLLRKGRESGTDAVEQHRGEAVEITLG
jgi:hypothetical protein